MNIAIAEILRKANEESKLILKNTPEKSLKRRLQIESYNYYNENKGYLSRLLSALKTHWYC
jgi:hypothetical protein